MSSQPSNPQAVKSWTSALKAFADRRALIMFLLGFSAGIPIFLIFSTLSFWLTEAGISRSTVTLFSWAALGYSFKFIWAPLIDKLPIIGLTKRMGQRRSWLLLSQIMVIIAICLMAMTNPSPQADYFTSVSNVAIMAAAAVFLGFSSATQDIVIDAYRIELTQDADVQTVLASTYNAGYRIATIITQLGALLFAASLGTAVGNYIYQAWQTTYLLMAGLMFIGIATTFYIKEPQVERQNSHYRTQDYLQLCFVFIISTILFVSGFYYMGELLAQLNVKDAFIKFLLVVAQFVSGVLCASVGVFGLIKSKIINQHIVVETWLSPLLDFFKRYGIKIALAILLLIGFYRISDIVAGVMANLFYLDLNFDKEEIAWFNKFFAIFFVILGGFVGGLLAQRYNVMKMLLLGAILASTTNLIFVGLVKSGASMQTVTVQVGSQQYQAQPDEVGNWKLQLDKSNLTQNAILQVSSQPKGYEQALNTQVPLMTYQKGDVPQIYVQPIAGQNQLYQNQLERDVIIQGTLLNLPSDAKVEKIALHLPEQTAIEGKVDKKHQWNMVVKGALLANQQRFDVIVDYVHQGEQQRITQQHDYTVLNSIQPNSRIQLATLPAIDMSDSNSVEIKGKVVVPYSKAWLVAGIIFDNLASGLAGAVFIAFLSSLTSISFTAMQYAIFTSLMLLLPKTIGGYSGAIVDELGYSGFFSLTFLMGIPILFLVIWVERLLRKSE